MSFICRKLGVPMNQGEDFSLTLELTSNSIPLNLTGYNFYGEMKLDTDPNTSIAAEFVFTILDQSADTGQVVWSLPASVSDTIELSLSDADRTKRLTTPFVFDIKMKDTLGKYTRVVEGIIYLSPQVTVEAP